MTITSIYHFLLCTKCYFGIFCISNHLLNKQKASALACKGPSMCLQTFSKYSVFSLRKCSLSCTTDLICGSKKPWQIRRHENAASLLEITTRLFLPTIPYRPALLSLSSNSNMSPLHSPRRISQFLVLESLFYCFLDILHSNTM